ncbi:hypothetical protein [Stappia sp.]|uniref:hypothetical protein n=1 Tax=Stappia sp. TaxID=1870903 RepID=UPI0032D918B5
MISLEDCIAMSGLSEEEIHAIAEHEHVSDAVACGLAQYLSAAKTGTQSVRDMIVDDIRAAQARGDAGHVRELLHVLHHFLRAHPEARPAVHPWSGRF